jgi:hypothetical protein
MHFMERILCREGLDMMAGEGESVANYLLTTRTAFATYHKKTTFYPLSSGTSEVITRRLRGNCRSR